MSTATSAGAPQASTKAKSLDSAPFSPQADRTHSAEAFTPPTAPTSPSKTLLPPLFCSKPRPFNIGSLRHSRGHLLSACQEYTPPTQPRIFPSRSQRTRKKRMYGDPSRAYATEKYTTLASPSTSSIGTNPQWRLSWL